MSKTILKIGLFPVTILIYILWAIAAVAAWLYSKAHGFLIFLKFIPTVLSCCFGLWWNALSFLIIGIVSIAVLVGLALLEGILRKLAAFMSLSKI